MSGDSRKQGVIDCSRLFLSLKKSWANLAGIISADQSPLNARRLACILLVSISSYHSRHSLASSYDANGGFQGPRLERSNQLENNDIIQKFGLLEFVAL